jgi:thiol-disulfide isomerase/thioredoxin
MRRWQRVAVIAVLAIASPAWSQEKEKARETPARPQTPTAKVKGRVVDETGKPVVGLEISRIWNSDRDGQLRPLEPVKSAADGTFSLELTFFNGQPNVLATIDPKRKRGGLVVVEVKNASEPVTIQVGPLVHYHGKYESKELGEPVGWTNTMLFVTPGNVRFYQYQSKDSLFDFWLPPRTYLLSGYGSSDVGRHRRELTLLIDKLDVDAGVVDLAASKIAKLKGKEAPTLLATDARGVKKNTQISDYKGKWVALEFWGYWCGPCVGGALPRMMEIYDDHADERDKFVILTVHSPDTKTFPDLDQKVQPVVRDIWAGRMIPFPILLDADAKIQQTFDVSHWPTTLLFDPQGKLVGEVQPNDLEAKLNKIPLEITLPRKLDRDTSVYFKNPTLKEAIENLKELSEAEFDLDPETLASLGLSESTKIPLVLSGRLSLRSALELLLDPIELTVKIGPKGYIFTLKLKAATSLTEVQKKCADRIERKLKQSKYTYNFGNATLAKVAAFFESQSMENVVLDPSGRLRGKINPEATITGSGKDVPLGEGLKTLVAPLGLRVVVRDEVIVLEAK